VAQLSTLGGIDMDIFQILVFCFLLLVLAIPLSALVRLCAALVSPRTRTSIVQHPVIHAIWFAIALASLLLIYLAQSNI
jgi:hypothetical protein